MNTSHEPIKVVATLTLRISASSGTYFIEAAGLANRTEPLPFVWSLSPEDEETLTKLQKSLQASTVSEERLVSLGQAIYGAVFVPKILQDYKTHREKIREGEGIRIRLIVEPPKLGHIPWEIMHDGQDFIALDIGFPLVRSMREVYDVERATVRGPIRILYVWAEPSELPRLTNLNESAKEIEKLVNENRRIKIDILPHATLERLRRALDSEYHIICFACHANPEYLCLETETGIGFQGLSAKDLVRALKRKPVRLVFLAACETAGRRSETEQWTGFAQTLANETQIPAIVAMQYAISNHEANLLAKRFFDTIAKFRPIDVALTEARITVMAPVAEQSSSQEAPANVPLPLRDVFAPVLYLQSKSSELFQRTRDWLAISLASVLLIAVISLIVLYRSYSQIDPSIAINAVNTAAVAQTNEGQQTSIALSRKLASEASIIGDQPDLRLLLNVLAYQVSPTFEARRSLFSSLESNKYITAVLHRHSGQISNLDFSSEGLISVGEDGKAFLWDMKSGAIDTELIDNSDSSFSATAYDATNETIAYVRNREISLFNLKNKTELSTILPEDALTINCIVFTPNGNLLIAGSGELGVFAKIGQISFWDVNNFEKQDSVITLPYPVRSIAISSTGRLVGLGLEDISGEKALLLFDVIERKPLGEPIGNIVTASITSLAFSPDEKYLAVGSEAPGPASPGGAIGVFDLETMQYIGNPKTSSTAEVSALKFIKLNYGGIALASNGGANDNLVLLWNPTNDSESFLQLRGHNSKVTQISIGDDGKTLVSGDLNGKIITWNLLNSYFPVPIGAPLILEEKLFGDTASNNQFVDNLHFSSDGGYIVGLDAQSSPVAWNIQTGDQTKLDNYTTFPFPQSEVTSLRNKLRLAVSENGITLTDTETNQEIGILPVRAQYLSLSPSEDYAVSYGYQSNAWMGEYPYLWNVSIDAWLSQACRMAGRNLTNEEWNKYLPGLPYREICNLPAN